MHRVPTYEEIVYEAIIHPTDKIALPDRQATFIRNLPQMTRFDEVDDPADLGKEQELIEEETMKEITLRKLAPGKTIALERAKATQRPVDSDYLRRWGPGWQPPPSAAVPRAQLALATVNPRRKGMLERAGDLVNWGLDTVISYEQRQAEIAEAEDTERQLGFVFGQAQHEEEFNLAQAADKAIRSETRQAIDSLTPASSVIYVPDDYDTGGPSASASSSAGTARASTSAASAREAPRQPQPATRPEPVIVPQIMAIADTDPPTPTIPANVPTYDLQEYAPTRRDQGYNDRQLVSGMRTLAGTFLGGGSMNRGYRYRSTG
jgi:hypothetical protein